MKTHKSNKTEEKKPAFYTPNEVAQMLRKTPITIYKMVNAGEFGNCKRKGGRGLGGGEILIPRENYEKYINDLPDTSKTPTAREIIASTLHQ